MLAPLAPHVAEELWSRLGHDRVADLRAVPGRRPRRCWSWSQVTCVLQVAGKVRDRIEVSPSIGEDELREQALASEAVQRALDGRGRAHRRRARAEAGQRRAGVAVGLGVGSLSPCPRTPASPSSPTRRATCRPSWSPSTASRSCRCRSSSAARRTTRAAGASSDTVAEALRSWTPVTTSRPAPAAFAAGVRARPPSAAATAWCRCTCRRRCPGTVESARLAAKESPVPHRGRRLAVARHGARLRRARRRRVAAAEGRPADEVARVAARTGRRLGRRLLRRHPRAPAPRWADRRRPPRCSARRWR